MTGTVKEAETLSQQPAKPKTTRATGPLAQRRQRANSRVGKPNKPKRQLESMLREAYGKDFDVILRMAEHANNVSMVARRCPTDVVAQLDAVNAWAKIAAYVKPQLKAIDLSSGGENIHFGFQLNLDKAAAPIEINTLSESDSD